MGITKSASLPTILKSEKTVAEINTTSQNNLNVRRAANIDREKFLFGEPKLPKARHQRLVISVNPNQKPRYVYK